MSVCGGWWWSFLVVSVSFEPELGELQPGGRGVVRVSLQGGRLPERLRGRLCCQVTTTTNRPAQLDPTDMRQQQQTRRAFFAAECRVRGVVVVQVKDVVGRSPASEQFVTYRAEVQELKVFLDQLRLDLGVVYVGVPVVRTLTLSNISNLSTNFKVRHPPTHPPLLAQAAAPCRP